MSTRCQVQVIQEGLEWEEKVTLYHHTDGYPTYIIPLIRKAFEYKGKYTEDWEKGRTGKVASFLCWADPGVFEPEDSHNLHPDIEYYYRLHIVNSAQGSLGEHPKWEVEIFVPIKGFCYSPEIDKMKCILPRTPLDKIKEDSIKELLTCFTEIML